MSKINLPLGATGIKVVVQPVVLFSICDAFIRRGDGQNRVIGTLLGTIEAGVIDLRLSYAVPHIETPESVSCCSADVTAVTGYKSSLRCELTDLPWSSTAC